ncbi:Protein FIZZY-RELATED 3 [Thelohanellus kitauei]|uniref:Protein FIZZY-RELATED 3 n=1 Tax=Thelohanellus kitauei TaxID=669202 RepID=A0A0C2MLU9_THEKT|nr:Protein FIZZY-RELATED 3 [Thelohanellus kitauei]
MLYLFDSEHLRFVDQRQVYTQRVGCIEWNGQLITTGSRDGVIRSFDMRSRSQPCSKGGHGHALEVCGLRWDPSGKVLASGGNDNKIFLWDAREEIPVCSLIGHHGAVKALAWSPHDPTLLATGGGTADRCIKFWNTKTNILTNSIDTRSQVCNLHWSTTDKELLSTHGFSSNAINLWTYPNMDQLISLKGHSQRVVYFVFPFLITERFTWRRKHCYWLIR